MTSDGAKSKSRQLNQGDNALGVDLSDDICPDCGRNTQRTMFSYRAYCPVCDTLWGRLKQLLGVIDTGDYDAQ